MGMPKIHENWDCEKIRAEFARHLQKLNDAWAEAEKIHDINNLQPYKEVAADINNLLSEMKAISQTYARLCIREKLGLDGRNQPLEDKIEKETEK